MLREKSKWKTHKDESTDTAYRGGTVRRSVEIPVMGMEQRGCVIHVLTIDQLCSRQRRNQWKKQNRLKFPSMLFGRLTNE
jgi:hypothetical protein